MLFFLQSTHFLQIIHQARSLAISVILILALLIFPFTPSVWAQEPAADTSPDSTEVAVNLASLVLQPVYLAAKLAIAVCGVAISAVTLLATGGNEEKAKEIFDASLAGPWGVPKLYEQIHHATPENE